jgi:hypothetical protein
MTIYTDAGTVLFKFTPSGTDVMLTVPTVDVGTVSLVLTPITIIDVRVLIDSGQIYLSFKPSADDHYCPQRVEFEGFFEPRWGGTERLRFAAQPVGGRWDANFLGTGEGYNC